MKSHKSIPLATSIILLVLLNTCKEKEVAPTLEVSFTISSNPAYALDTIYFNNTSTGADTFKWFFGDGKVSTEENPYHIYSGEGNYTVTLEASSADKSELSNQEITIAPPYEPWVEHIIDAGVITAVDIDMADIDADGDFDIIVPLFGNGQMVWYENNFPEFTKHIIDANAHTVTFAYCDDMDSDGTPDVVAVLYEYKDLVVYLNKSTGWVKDTIDDQTDHADIFYLEDMNGDNKIDVVACGDYINGGNLIWYENSHPDYTKHIIEDGTQKYFGIYNSDLDQDGKADILSTKNAAKEVVWYAHEGQGLNWTTQTIATNITNPCLAIDADINGDNKLDVVVTTGGPYLPGKEVLWYENPTWTMHTIDNDFDGATWPYYLDIDDDGSLELIVTSTRQNKIVKYEYDQTSWIKTDVASVNGPRALYFIDLNSDNLKDIIVAGSKSVVWYEQKVREF